MSLSPYDIDSLRQDADELSLKLVRSKSRGEALENAINAADTSMRALKLAENPIDRSQLSRRVTQLLQEAEQIKTNSDWRPRSQDSPILDDASGRAAFIASRDFKEPTSSRKLPTSEQILVLRASILNGTKYPPWTKEPTPEEFALKGGEQLYSDGAELSLSDFQREVFDGWKRPFEALPPPAWLSRDDTNPGPSMEHSKRIDVVQDAATDCSVVASLCAGVARAERSHAKILRSVLFPYDSEGGRPLLSQNGKYVVRLNFNGCYRRVVIDDTLPTSKTTRVIHVVDRANPGLLWPSLLEKAYLKVRGGYDFPGSNSGTDLWILSGWIPEQVFLQSDELEPDIFWRQTLNAFIYGDVMVTMGTGKISARAEKEIGLAGQHDYAVLDVREIDGQRLFLIKNPWCEGTSWRGRFKEPSYVSDTGTGATNAGAWETEEPVQSSRDLLNADDQLSPGTFWMDLDNVIQNFESIYLNWNPAIFSHRQDLHFSWNLADPTTACRRYASLKSHPQFVVTSQKRATIWLLLCRHFRGVDQSDHQDPQRQDIDIRGFISLHAFHSGGHRLLLAEKVVNKSNFVDSPQNLLKLEHCEAGKPITLVPGEQELPPVNLTFTLSAWSDATFTLQEATERFPCNTDIFGAWQKDTAGGNAHSPTYSTNPQFSVEVTRKTSISLLLEADDDALNVHLKLVHGYGKRVRAIRARDIVADSKDYRRRCCIAEAGSVEPGKYTIICSTFEPNQLSRFNILAESMHPIRLALLPREGAGRLRTDLPIAGFAQDNNRIAIPLIPKRLSKLYVVARPVGPQTAGCSARTSLIRLSIEVGRGPHRRTLTSSGGGEYSDSSASGIQTDDLDIEPNMRRLGDVWLLLERMYAHSQVAEERFEVELFVDQPGAVEWGTWRATDD
jgi:calpain-7